MVISVVVGVGVFVAIFVFNLFDDGRMVIIAAAAALLLMVAFGNGCGC